MELQSARLTYEKFNPAHFENYHKLVSRQEVMEYITGEALDVESAEKRFDVALRADRGRDDMGFLTVFEKASGKFIGLGKIVPFEEEYIELGYALLPDFWGQGYASEITARLIEYAKELGNIDRLIALVMPENLPSVRVLTKHGFVFYREVAGKAATRNDYVLYL